jgi:hypothetical protein
MWVHLALVCTLVTPAVATEYCASRRTLVDTASCCACVCTCHVHVATLMHTRDMCCCCCCCCCCGLSFLQLLWDLSRDVAFKRAVFLAVQGRTGPGCSVLVTDVPGLEWGTPLHRVSNEDLLLRPVRGLHACQAQCADSSAAVCWSMTCLDWSGAHLCTG